MDAKKRLINTDTLGTSGTSSTSIGLFIDGRGLYDIEVRLPDVTAADPSPRARKRRWRRDKPSDEVVAAAFKATYPEGANPPFLRSRES